MEGSMPKLAELFFKTAIIFLIVGIGIGLHMAIGRDHSAMGAHAHINLLGWVTSAIFGTYYALNPGKAASRIAQAHYWVYTVGVVVMTASLYMLLTGNLAFEAPVAIGSMVTFLGVLLFAWVLFAPARATMPLMPKLSA
jgi:cbb3-type cytochrome oxidase subunit 1